MIGFRKKHKDQDSSQTSKKRWQQELETNNAPGASALDEEEIKKDLATSKIDSEEGSEKELQISASKQNVTHS